LTAAKVERIVICVCCGGAAGSPAGAPVHPLTAENVRVW